MKKLLFVFSLSWILLLSASQKQNGTLCLTFDDRYLNNWEKAIPLFKQYNARVTFFIYKNIDDEVLKNASILYLENKIYGIISYELFFNYALAQNLIQFQPFGITLNPDIITNLKYDVVFAEDAFNFNRLYANIKSDEDEEIVLQIDCSGFCRKSKETGM